ncbi:MAG: hypothetical protein HFJ25_04290 [Clostridia bacterium]|nr:hypothetical protein [Clostridia bacterium]
MNYLLRQAELFGSLAAITSIIPEIYFRPPGNNILIIFKDQLPTVEETAKIEAKLESFGDVTPHIYRKHSLIAFHIN